MLINGHVVARYEVVFLKSSKFLKKKQKVQITRTVRPVSSLCRALKHNNNYN